MIYVKRVALKMGEPCLSDWCIFPQLIDKYNAGQV